LAALPLSLIIPLSANFVTIKSYDAPIIEEFTETVTVNLKAVASLEKSVPENLSSPLSILIVSIYLIGIVLMLINLFLSMRKMFLLEGVSRKNSSEQFYEVSDISISPFSFFNWIFIPENYQKSHLQTILNHERRHIAMKHSFDLLFLELYAVFFWFNPLLRAFRKSIKNIHEFQVDQSIIDTSESNVAYLEVFLETLQQRKLTNLQNYFNQITLKKRIDMMTKEKSTRWAKLKYTVYLPVLAVLFMAFATPDHERILSSVEIIESMSNAPSFIFPIKGKTKEDITADYGITGKHAITGKHRVHSGIDIKAATGTEVVATADGVITLAKYEGNWGNLIVIKHNNGYETRYAHLNGFKITAEDRVKKGDIIGYVGSTGLSTVAHLHFEMSKNGESINPVKMF
ncbi:MAG: peptidoglycan DD-metalloendopeptidase family protein, partial [Flavobacteriaceae bacterium]|nr:peptidoglycan DD-metalloendopeptidase family protein [Flavobacteriaceae bacterium]